LDELKDLEGRNWIFMDSSVMDISVMILERNYMCIIWLKGRSYIFLCRKPVANLISVVCL